MAAWRKIKVLILYIHNETKHAMNKKILHLRPGLKVTQLRLKYGAVALWERALAQNTEALLVVIFMSIFQCYFLAILVTYNKNIWTASHI